MSKIGPHKDRSTRAHMRNCWYVYVSVSEDIVIVHSYHVHLCILTTPAELPFATFIYRLYCFSGEKLNNTAAQKKVQTILILTRCVIGKVTE